jgi:hypothetical protein
MASTKFYAHKIAPSADGVFARLCVVPDLLDIT